MWVAGMSDTDLAVCGLLCLFLILGEVMPIWIRRGDTFEAYTFSATAAVALIITGPVALALATQLLASLFDEVRRKNTWYKSAFNLAQYTLSVVGARATFALMTGEPVHGYHTRFTPDYLFAAFIAGIVFFLINVVLISTVLSIANGNRPLLSLINYIRDELPMATTLIGAGPIVLVALRFSWVLAPICMLPALAVRQGAKTAADRELQAMHDSLTGLPNRSLLLQRTVKALQRRERHEQVALLLIDLDHFKEVNDTLGHPVGDELLKQVAQRLSATIRSEDMAARLGGDEFAVLCTGVEDEALATSIADRIVKALGEPFSLDAITLHVEASVGIALAPQHAEDVDQLLQRADVALYQAKGAGRHVVRAYDPTSDSNSIERLALMEQLRAGMDEQLVVYYQPKCRISDGQMIGVEALVRWEHPQLGLLLPGRFLPSAENSGLIVPLTLHVLRQALSQVRTWRDSGLDLSVAVNVSPRHLTHADLPKRVSELLDEFGLPGTRLIVEVTESSLMSDPERAIQVLSQLRALGVGVSIDDFGTGYSSLGYLRDLCATEVKIDRTFTAAVTDSNRDVSLVRAAAELGHSLGLRVVAEGIESPEAVPILLEAGVDLLQGFLILPPVPASELSAWSHRPQVWSRNLRLPQARAQLAGAGQP